MAEIKMGGVPGYLRIATEEAFTTPELNAGFRDELGTPDVEPGFFSLVGFYMDHPAPRPQFIAKALLDLGEGRIADMDARGIDRQVLALTAPSTNAIRDTARATMMLKPRTTALPKRSRSIPRASAAWRPAPFRTGRAPRRKSNAPSPSSASPQWWSTVISLANISTIRNSIRCSKPPKR
jgi:hypothetical protein